MVENKKIDPVLKELVLKRLETLELDEKLIFAGGGEVSVRQMIEHVKSEDEFGRKMVKVQLKMLQILASN